MKDLRSFFIVSPWWGKIIGAIFGFMAGRAVGAILGLIIGNFFDRGLAGYFSKPYWSYHAERRKAVQKIFYETTFLCLGHIAKTDGRVTASEIHMAQQLMDDMQLSKEQKVEAKRLFNEGKQPQFDLNRHLMRLRSACQDNHDLLKMFVDIQYRAASIEGLTSKKIKSLDQIFSILGFAPLHKQYRFYQDYGFDAFKYRAQQEQQHRSSSYQDRESTYNHSPPNNLAHAFAVLEISAEASQQEVKKAYRRLLSRNHPDKLIAQGLPENMIKMANEKTLKIRKAYEHICTAKGWAF